MEHNRPILLGNWKMNFKKEDSTSFFSEFLNLIADSNISASSIVGVAPPFTIIDHVAKIIESSSTNILLGSQNIHWLNSGAHTGEISPIMLNDLGVNFSIIGHSERRNLYGETNQNACMRTKSAVDANIIPVVCVGENEYDYKAGRSSDIVLDQLRKTLMDVVIKEKNIPKTNNPSLIIAYEPVWAIGTGLSASPDEANNICKLIKEFSRSQFELDIPILYGGSVDQNNVKNLYSGDSIDGFLVGGASLKPSIFFEMISLCLK